MSFLITKNIEMHSYLLQQTAQTSPALHPESSAKYVHLAGLLAYRTFETVFPFFVIEQ